MPNIADFKSSLEAKEIEERLVGAVISTRDMTGEISPEQQAIFRNNIGASAFGQGIKIMSHFDSLAELEAAITDPQPGSAYSVGAALPYNLYVYDLLHGEWKDYGAIRSSDISARLAQNVAVSTAAWQEDDAVFPDYKYKARIPLGEINGGDFPIVAFSPSDATGGNYSPIAFCFDGYVEIWAKAIPTASILIPAITFIINPDNAGAASTKGITNACGGVGTAGVTNAMLAKDSVTADKIAPGAVAKVYTATIHTEWEGDDAPYTQTILVDGLPDSNRIFADVVLSEDLDTAEAEDAEYAKIYKMKVTPGQLTVIASDKTELPLNIKLTVFHGDGMGTGGSGVGGNENGGGGGAGAFVFGVSGDAESGYTSTASYDEILAAYNSGQIINCKANVYGDDVVCQLFLVDDEGALFSATCANLGVIVDVKPAGVNLELVQVGSGGNSPTINHEAIVADVIKQLGAMVLGKVDSENNIIITATLPGGTYTMRYEYADGSTTEIGTFTVNGAGGGSGGGGNTSPAYTNLADPTSSDWLTNKRINSSKNIVDVTEAQSGGKTCVVTNFIPVAGISKLHIKGLNILDNVSGTTNYGRVYTYNNGTILDVTYQPNTGISGTGKTHYSMADYDNSVVIFDLSAFLVDFNKTNATHIRFGGFLTGTAEDVIITADEKIV